MAENEEELKSLLMKVKEESKKAGLKLHIKKLRSRHPVPSLYGKRWGKNRNSDRLFSWVPKSLWMVTAPMKLKKNACFLEDKLWQNLDSVLKSRDITLPTNVQIVKVMVFSVVLYGCELDHKEGWALKNWCFWTVVLEKTLESPLNSKEIKQVNPKGNQPWIFTGRTDDDAPIFSPPDAKSQLIGKDPDAGKDWRQEKGMTEEEMVR